ncbi:MAG: transglycosylase SLT domain-containing protein [Bryobacteraceae bacterium]|jgi:pSer/pThr/pTyr-binding forkhead associated (FHA) protein
MPQQPTADAQFKTWVLIHSGPLAGTRFPISEGITRVGRGPENDVVISGADTAMVSLNHLEIYKDGASLRLRDLGSTNGTLLNGERVAEAEVILPATLQLGNRGPELALVLEEAPVSELDRTIEILADAVPPPRPPSTVSTAHEGLLSAAVARARRLRARGIGGETLTIMRDVIDKALDRSHRRLRIVSYVLTAALVTVTGLGIWRITALNRQKHEIDGHIQQLEAELQRASGADVDTLLSRLDSYQNLGEALQQSLLYRIGPHEEGAFVTREMRAVMTDLGAEVYSVPPEFMDQVKRYIAKDEGPNRTLIERALRDGGEQLQTMRHILTEEHLPPDLAYVPIVESALEKRQTSAAGAAGPWQMTVVTARAYGLRVDSEVDEREDRVKSTVAASKYLRDLILDFGTGSSVMLALAAYNSGAAAVKQAVVRNVRDPIKQRNFWYLYRRKALPLETREYVPKVFAAILIGRAPEQFGFSK